MRTDLPKKLPAKGISILFGVSEARVSQLKRSGRLKSDSENMFDVKDAIQMRGFQMSEHGVRMVAQMYSNKHGHLSPPKVTALTLDQELGLEDEPDEVAENTPSVKSSPDSHFVQQSRLLDLRTQRAESEAELRRLRVDRERGEVISRAEVQTAAADAAALIVTILQALPAEIAAVFAAPEQKREVRAKVQQRVDQAQHALWKAMKGDEQDDPS